MRKFESEKVESWKVGKFESEKVRKLESLKVESWVIYFVNSFGLGFFRCLVFCSRFCLVVLRRVGFFLFLGFVGFLG